jgi:transcriptional regulator of met regulon
MNLEVWVMRFNLPIALLFLSVLHCPCIGRGQGKENRAIELHQNVKLVEIPAPDEMPEGLGGEYRQFLPVLEGILREVTDEQPQECALTIRVSAGLKEIGTAKTKRVYARVTAFRQRSSREVIGDLYLHSFATGQTVSKEETLTFVQQRILNPATCQH